jgi:hypothetical protein
MQNNEAIVECFDRHGYHVNVSTVHNNDTLMPEAERMYQQIICLFHVVDAVFSPKTMRFCPF